MDLLEWAEAKNNFSGYVKGLIKRDMGGDDNIRRIIEVVLEKKGSGLPGDEFLKGIF